MSWIKIRTNLHEDPRVMMIAKRVGVDVHHAVGMLVRLWGYADSHSTDGRLRFMESRNLDDLVSRSGFADALREVGWVEFGDACAMLPRYAEHNGSTAKERAQTAVRVSRSRARDRNGDSVTPCNGESVTGGPDGVTGEPLPEERRGEKKRREREGRARDGKKGWL